MTDTTEPKPARDMKMPCFLIGLGAGVAMALLFAPASGPSTRRLITRTARNSRDWVQDQAENVSYAADLVHDRVEEVAKRVGLA